MNDTDELRCPDCGGEIRAEDWGDQGTYFECTDCEYHQVP